MEKIKDFTFGQWFFIATVPLITCLFLHAAIQTVRMHQQINFDSGTLMWCTLINLIAILLEFQCFNALAIFNQIMQTGMMIYILFRVSLLLTRQSQNTAILQDRVSTISCAVACMMMVGLFVYALLEESQIQFIIIKLVEFLLGFLILFQCSRLQQILSHNDFQNFVTKPYSNRTAEESDFIEMRKKQLKVVKLSYLFQNVLFAVEFFIYFTQNSQFGCAKANSEFSAIFRGICELIPTELFLISFWFIPRRFYTYSSVDIWPTQEKQDIIIQPLLSESESTVLLKQTETTLVKPQQLFSRRGSKIRERISHNEENFINMSRLTDTPTNQQH